jgi:hypothetical protein
MDKPTNKLIDNSSKKKNRKTIIIVVVVVILLLAVIGLSAGGAVCWWKRSAGEIEKRDLETTKKELQQKVSEFQKQVEQVKSENEELKEEVKGLKAERKGSQVEDQVEQAPTCDFTKPINLRTTSRYGIFGDDEFDTIVCGYLELKDEVVFDEKQTNAYFNIKKFYDDGFRKSLDQGISEGNTINQKVDSTYRFNLGCYENGKITGIEYDPNQEYINETAQKRILSSTSDNPTSIILSFGKHEGRGCQCCNLAHKIRIYE